MTASFRIGLTAVSLVALLAGGAQAQTRTLTMPEDLCLVDPLPRSAIRQIRARSDFSALLDYAARECPEVALLLTEAPTATIGVGPDPSSRGDYEAAATGEPVDDGDGDDGDDDHDHGDDHGGGHGGGGGEGGHGGGQGGQGGQGGHGGGGGQGGHGGGGEGGHGGGQGGQGGQGGHGGGGGQGGHGGGGGQGGQGGHGGPIGGGGHDGGEGGHEDGEDHDHDQPA